MGELGGRGRKKIVFVLQTTTSDPLTVSPEVRWEIQTDLFGFVRTYP